jgi:hypothetical protein
MSRDAYSSTVVILFPWHRQPIRIQRIDIYNESTEYLGAPHIVNLFQDSKFTSPVWTSTIKNNVKISIYSKVELLQHLDMTFEKPPITTLSLLNLQKQAMNFIKR